MLSPAYRHRPAVLAALLAVIFAWAMSGAYAHAQGTNTPPSFANATEARTVDENSNAGINIGDPVTATDSEGDTLIYSLGGADAASFTIASGTGQIRVGAGADLNYEVKSAYTVTVTATEADDPSSAATVSVNITVNDVDEAPAFDAGDASRSIDENSLPGTDLGAPVAAVDPEGATVTYSLGGDDAASFTIMSGSGQVQVAQGAALDYEEKAVYAVTVTASDSVSSSSLTVNITLNDVNEPPVFDPSSVTRSIAENSSAGTDVGTPVAAADPEGGVLTYALGGADAGSFVINSGSGQLQVGPGATLDHEDKSALTVTVTASDPLGLSQTVTVNVEVVDVNDAPRFPSPSATFTVHDRTAAGGDVGTPVTAIDQDGDALTYTLSGPDASTFDLDTASGQLTLAPTAAIAAGSSYSVAVAATDDSRASTTIPVTIQVTTYVPPELPGPPTMGLNAMLCMGFPGCPDSYLFLFPTLAVLGVSAASWKLSRGRRRLPNVYVLLGVWGVSVLGTTILVKANPMLALAFIAIPIMVGMVWLALGGARR